MRAMMRRRTEFRIKVSSGHQQPQSQIVARVVGGMKKGGKGCRGYCFRRRCRRSDRRVLYGSGCSSASGSSSMETGDLDSEVDGESEGPCEWPELQLSRDGRSFSSRSVRASSQSPSESSSESIIHDAFSFSKSNCKNVWVSRAKHIMNHGLDLRVRTLYTR